MQKDIDYWLNLAQYDIKTAQAMLNSGRYLYVLFTCQQALEKTLKALVVKTTNQFPPRIHDLLKLAEKGQLELSDRQAEFLSKLSFYYLESRYPEQIIDLSKETNKEMAETYLNKSMEVLKWLDKKVK